MRNNSRMTSVSFTVQDDLVSESSLNSTQKTAFKGLRPFANQYGLKNSVQQRPLPNKQNKQILQRAQNDAYRQMNEQMFNPFEHKLNQGFIPKQSDLYRSQKQKQMEMLRKKQQDMMNTNKNYTIVFNQSKGKNNLQKAGKNVLGEQNPTISDYYNKKFQKNMDNIAQQDHDDELDHNSENKKIDNFVNSAKKVQKKIPIPPRRKPEVFKKKSEEIHFKNDTQPPSLQNQNRVNSSYDQQKKRVPQKKVINKVQPKPIEHPKSQNIIPERKQVNRVPQKKQTTKKPPVPKKNQYKKETNQSKGGKKKYSDVYEGSDKNLVQQLQRELTSCPNITFDDIAELDTAKNLLQEAVLLPRLMPEFFKGIRKAMKGILLFGPPGTGKTLLAKAVAQNNIFLNVSASSLASKWKGQSQKMVKLLFQIAKFHSPSVIFFDEIDCIGSRRSENEHQSARKVKTQLLVQMDGVGSTDSEIFVLAATNRPWDLDEALRRRLEKRIYIPLPGKEGRKQMFNINLKELKISSKISWDKLAEATKGYSGADICNVCRDAAYMPMRKKLNQIGGIKKLQELKQEDIIEQQISESDLIEATKKVKPSVGQDDLKKYSAWMSEFGST